MINFNLLLMEISIPQVKFDEMSNNICGQQIAKGYISNTIMFAGSEYIIISGHGGNKAHLSAYQVVHLSKYKGSLTPLEYRMHFLAVDTGRRARGYNGMLIKHGQRKLVLVGDEIHFFPSAEGMQLGLF